MVLTLVLAACSQAPETKPTPAPSLPAGVTLEPVSFSALPGWADDRIEEALPALRRSCGMLAKRSDGTAWLGPLPQAGQVEVWQKLCADLDRALPATLAPDPLALRTLLEDRLQPYALRKDGVADGTFTGYYEAELKGSRQPGPDYPVPLHGVPADLVTVDLGAQYPDLKGQKITGRRQGDQVVPYWTRGEIEAGVSGFQAPVIAWLADAVDAHILHIQGSGRISLPDGSVMRVGYAGNNGHAFVGIGKVMLDRGLLPPGQASMPAIRAWLKAHPQDALSVLAANPRYIFFRENRGEGPLGAMGVALTPRRSLAVDPAFVPMGIPLWLDSLDPDGRPLRRLMVAQDVGSAIKGAVRGDFFWGFGEAALADAGRMKSPGRWFLLLPRAESPVQTGEKGGETGGWKSLLVWF